MNRSYQPSSQSKRTAQSLMAGINLLKRLNRRARARGNSIAKAAQRDSSLSYRQALKQIDAIPRASSARSNCFMNDDFPAPHSPSTEIVKGGSVSGSAKNSATA